MNRTPKEQLIRNLLSHRWHPREEERCVVPGCGGYRRGGTYWCFKHYAERRRDRGEVKF